MSVNELERYIESLINANKQEASTYSNNVKVKIKGYKILISFNSPTSFKLNEELYFDIFDVINVPVFPIITLIPQEQMVVEEFENANIENKRCFVYPFRIGVPKRKIYNSKTEFENSLKNGKYEIMSGIDFTMNDLTSVAISSTSGGGKSYLINQFLIYFKKQGCELIVIDGKKDLPSRFARENNVKLITSRANKSDDNILIEVCDELSRLNDLITERQNLLFENKVTENQLKPVVLVFDEIGALTSLASKNVKENFFKLLTRVATLGRQSKVHLLISSQRLDSNTIPTIVKEQCNILIQLGSLTSNQMQYLFPDYEHFTMLVPFDEIGNKGRGIISINNELFTFLVPTIKERIV